MEQQFETLFVDSFSGQTGDVIAELRLPRETLALGAKIPLTFTRQVACDTCKGSGGVPDAPPCTECKQGYTKVDATVEVEIPAGSAPGMQVRVAGQGHVRPDKPQGDVVVVLAAGIEESSAAAQKLPSMIVFAILTIIVLVIAIMMAQKG